MRRVSRGVAGLGTAAGLLVLRAKTFSRGPRSDGGMGKGSV